jgi:hypothetical protein
MAVKHGLLLWKKECNMKSIWKQSNEENIFYLRDKNYDRNTKVMQRITTLSFIARLGFNYQQRFFLP